MDDESREAKLKRFLEWTWDKPDALDWLFLPNQHFNQGAPIQVIAAGGMDEVIKHLEEDFNQVAT